MYSLSTFIVHTELTQDPTQDSMIIHIEKCNGASSMLSYDAIYRYISPEI
jgi:hypothetical protein